MEGEVAEFAESQLCCWAAHETIADSLVLQALRQAILRRSPPEKLICHTDRGVQYAGNDFKMKFKTREETKRKVFSPFEYEKQAVLTL